MRIASLSPAVTEILFALEQQKKIVCTDKFSDVPEAVSLLPHLPEHQKVKADDLKLYAPDLVFTSTLVQQKLAESLRGEGFTVIHQDPRSVADIYDGIRAIGTLLDCSARAEGLIATMQQGFSATKRKAGLLSRRPRVYVEEWHHPPMVSGNWVPEVVKIGGGIPFDVASGPRFAEATRGRQTSEDSAGLPPRNPPSREVTLEEIRSFDPDVIVLSICGAGSAANKDLLTSRAGWAELRAVQSNHLFVIDDSLLNRPGPRLTEGAARLFGWCFQVMHS